MASGIVRVTPSLEPAKAMVAPNSPRLRPRARAVPRARAGVASGSVTCARTRHGPAPRLRAVTSARLSRLRSAASRVTTRKGMETNTWAITTAVVEKAMGIPHSFRCAPSRPRLPKVDSSAIPATTGGIVIGSTARIRAILTPGQLRASSSASGTPSTTQTTVELKQVRIDSHRAACADGVASSWGSCPQDTRVPIPTRGRTIAQPPKTASAVTRTGRGERAARPRPRRARTGRHIDCCSDRTVGDIWFTDSCLPGH